MSVVRAPNSKAKKTCGEKPKMCKVPGAGVSGEPIFSSKGQGRG